MIQSKIDIFLKESYTFLKIKQGNTVFKYPKILFFYKLSMKYLTKNIADAPGMGTTSMSTVKNAWQLEEHLYLLQVSKVWLSSFITIESLSLCPKAFRSPLKDIIYSQVCREPPKDVLLSSASWRCNLRLLLRFDHGAKWR